MGEETKQEELGTAEVKKEESNKEEKAEEEKEGSKKAEEGSKKKEEEDSRKEEEDSKKKEEEAVPPSPPPPPPLVLYVDLHCVGCAKKIERSIMKIRGVEGVAIDMARNQVTIKGVVETEAICNMIIRKTKKSVQVLSPLPANMGEPTPQLVTSQVSGLTTVELNVNMHCEACAAQLKKKLLKMRGVQTAETEASSGKVTVSGTMDADKLVDYVYRRTKKQARIVPQPQPEPEPESPPEEAKPEEEKESKPKGDGGGDEEAGAENKKEGGAATLNVEEETMKRMMHYYYNHNYNYNYQQQQQQPLYVIEGIPPPPQLFSDENPNACTIS